MELEDLCWARVDEKESSSKDEFLISSHSQILLSRTSHRMTKRRRRSAGGQGMYVEKLFQVTSRVLGRLIRVDWSSHWENQDWRWRWCREDTYGRLTRYWTWISRISSKQATQKEWWVSGIIGIDIQMKKWNVLVAATHRLGGLGGDRSAPWKYDGPGDDERGLRWGMEHVDGLIKIYQWDPLFSSAFEDIKVRKGVLTGLKSCWDSTFPKAGNIGTIGNQNIQSLDNIVIAM